MSYSINLFILRIKSRYRQTGGSLDMDMHAWPFTRELVRDRGHVTYVQQTVVKRIDGVGSQHISSIAMYQRGFLPAVIIPTISVSRPEYFTVGRGPNAWSQRDFVARYQDRAYTTETLPPPLSLPRAQPTLI
jgi:hypothetical protein